MSDSRNPFNLGRSRRVGPFSRLQRSMAARWAASFALDLSEEDFLDLMRKRRDEMLRELKAPPSWRWFKRHVLRSGDEVTVNGLELKRLLRMAEMAVPEEADDTRYLRLPLRPFADLLAKAEARHAAKQGDS